MAQGLLQPGTLKENGRQAPPLSAAGLWFRRCRQEIGTSDYSYQRKLSLVASAELELSHISQSSVGEECYYRDEVYMIFRKVKKLVIEDQEIAIKKVGNEDYLSLTDMLKSKDGEFFVADWLRNKNTLEFLGVWEQMHNPDFNYGEFAIIMGQAGVRRFKISVKEWVEQTKAIGLNAQTGRHGGTYAHRDIAFEFGTWINPTFKMYLIKEYQRLKEIESNTYNLEWNVKRLMSKTNYIVHTDAVKEHLIPEITWRKNFTYADEADLINLVLFGVTAKEWRNENEDKDRQGLNIRDNASINELTVLSNLESYNAVLLKQKIKKQERFNKLREMAVTQMRSLQKTDPIKSLKKINDATYIKVSGKLGKDKD